MVMCVLWVDTLVFGIRLLVSALCRGGRRLIQPILNCYSKISWLPLNAALQQVHKIFFLVSIILFMHVVINEEDCHYFQLSEFEHVASLSCKLCHCIWSLRALLHECLILFALLIRLVLPINLSKSFP
jgi:hypothetical protein